MTATTVDRADVLAFRFQRHQLHREARSAAPLDVDLLDLGVQETGNAGSGWALEVRGAKAAKDDDLLIAWTLRGAPHAYRREDVAAVTVATAPFSEADAASRLFDGAKPLLARGIAALDAMRTIAEEQRDIVRRPMPKGDVSSALTDRLPEPFLRDCRRCEATHVYEQGFRLPPLQGGLELEPGTSPPVLRRIRGVRPKPYSRLGAEADDRFHVVRGYLRFYGPATVKAIAEFLDAPVREVKAQLPDDVLEVEVEGVPGKGPRFLLAADLEALTTSRERAAEGVVRVVGSHDPYLQLRDRELLVDDEARRKELWRIIGRPGAVLVDGEVAATWRPRAKGGELAVQVEPWRPMRGAPRRALEAELERLATHRGLTLTSVELT